MHRAEAETKFLRLKWRRAFDRWRGKAALLVIAAKGGFDPNQPRVPAGNPNGGRWTGGGGGDRTSSRRRDPGEGRVISDATPDNLQKPGARLAQARGGHGTSIRVGNRRLPASLGQRMRYSAADRRAKRLIRQVKDIDPTWKPQRSATDPTSATGAIAIRRGEAREAEARLRELASQSPTQLIDTYRTLNNSRDLFGNETWPRDRGAVMTLTIDRLPIIGANSRSPAYTSLDQRDANQLRAETVPRLPKALQRDNLGQIPYDAFYHAETTVLLRAQRANGGTLAGRRLVVIGDRETCPSCLDILPHIGLRLGNPTVTFVGPSGNRITMRDGKWVPAFRRGK